MIPRAFINLVVIFAFIALVGFSVAQSLKYGSAVGFILAMTSLGAAVYFIYLLVNAKQERNTEERYSE